MTHDLEEMFKHLHTGESIQTEFYPYAGIRHSIRKRKGKILIRISDTFSEAPQDVLLALGRILLAKLNKSHVSKKDRTVYNQYVASEELQDRATAILSNRKRAVRIMKGNHRSLADSFQRVNAAYFGGSMEKPTLTWGIKRAHRTLGRYDLQRDIVFLSPVLDSYEVPEEFLDFIMYHELLHKKHGLREKGGRIWAHTRQFRNDEKRFYNYEQMKKIMSQIAKT
ncbi:MAG: hypothetical protein HXS52_02010 [Theionarchaea archaeon]|nr:hypothetical protein [Theionarchaea archaeon]MBU7036679.1 hypothetical protein [Theionarchaea archaeon]